MVFHTLSHRKKLSMGMQYVQRHKNPKPATQENLLDFVLNLVQLKFKLLKEITFNGIWTKEDYIYLKIP